MKSLHCETRPELIFEEMDALHMQFKDETFNVVFDKGTLDALMADDKADTRNRISGFLNVSFLS